MVRAGRYYGPGRTNNEAEAFAMRDAVECLARIRHKRPDLGLPVRVFGDSQLMIRFMTRLYKRPSRQSIYWALEEVRKSERTLPKPVAYRHVTRVANQVADDMARRALEIKGDVVFWGGELPEDALPNQVEEVYMQQATPNQLDWEGLPVGFDPPPPLDISAMPTAAAIFGPAVEDRMRQLGLRDVLKDTRMAALERLREVTSLDGPDCLATSAVPPSSDYWGSLATWAQLSGQRPGIAAILEAAGLAQDLRPCTHCG